ncbi:MAG: IS1182 family transposase [Bacilli bacterium]|nr:IS1182 family transposase [Bacilli bacterium]
MLPKSQKLRLSEYIGLYDIIIEKDHWIRKLHDIIDYEFIYDELKDKYCDDNGALAYDPIIMFKLLMLKAKYKLSDRDLIERGKTDMAIKYFLDLTPEAEMPHPTLLTKFRKLRLNDESLLSTLIAKTIIVAKEKGILNTKTIIVDSTHTKSVYNPMTPVEILQEESKKLRKAVYEVDETYKDKMPSKPVSDNLDAHITYCKGLVETLKKDKTLEPYTGVIEKENYLEEIINDNIENKISLNDEEARIGHKTADTSFFGYKTHIAMSPERIITGAIVTTGDKSDGTCTQELIEQSNDNGYTVDTLIGDGAYSGKDDLQYGKENNIKIIAKMNDFVRNGNPTASKCKGFTYNKDAGMYVCTAGHMAIKKVNSKGKKDKTQARQVTFFFDVNKCKNCPNKNGCYKENSKTKTFTLRTPSLIHREQLEYMNSEEFKSLYKERYKIEAKNSELKNSYGINKTYTSGTFGMQLQSVVAIFTCNLKRIITIENEKEDNK